MADQQRHTYAGCKDTKGGINKCPKINWWVRVENGTKQRNRKGTKRMIRKVEKETKKFSKNRKKTKN